MKTYLVMLTLGFSLVAHLYAQDPPALDVQLSDLWKKKDYTGLRTLIDAKTAATPADPVALYCAKFFYIFVQPDKIKALAAATKLKAIAQATGDADFLSFADRELAEVQGIPDAEFTPPSAEVLAMLHKEFPERYPNVDWAARLTKHNPP